MQAQSAKKLIDRTERNETENSLRNPNLATLEELNRVELEYDFTSNVRNAKEILLEAQQRLCYESMTYYCCIICDLNIVKNKTKFYKIEDEIINVSLQFLYFPFQFSLQLKFILNILS